MKFICLEFMEESPEPAMPEVERKSFVQQRLAVGDELRQSGHVLGEEVLQTGRNAATVRSLNGQVIVTAGPYAETGQQLGTILLLEARDLNHAIQLMAKHPRIGTGAFEIRAVENGMADKNR